MVFLGVGVEQMRRQRLTEVKVLEFNLPDGKRQAFLWDSEVPGLAVRVTAGSRSYIYQAQLHGRSVRLTIGAPAIWKLGDARSEARRLRGLFDRGIDPRIEKAEKAEADDAKRREIRRQSVSVSEAWSAYVSSNADRWGVYHLRDHEAVARRKGEPVRGGRDAACGGPLAPLMDLKLSALDAVCLEAWIKAESKDRPRVADKAFRLLRAFLNWCEEQPDLKGVVPSAGIKARQVRRHVPKMTAKRDVLQREMLPDFFLETRRMQNFLHSAYLQLLLLLGCRPGELLAARWEDLDLKWRTIEVRDKDESKGGFDGRRIIPIGPYVAHLLDELRTRAEKDVNGYPKSPFIFNNRQSANVGHMASPNDALDRVVQAAGLPSLTLHGLRRSFSSLTEWLEWPAGVKAQITGHKPSATAEKHYTIRPVELLRKYQESFERWVLSEARVAFYSDMSATVLPLRRTG